MVMNWLFGRQQEDQPRPQSTQSTQATEVPDSPTALAAEVFRVNRFVNASAGQLPGEGVVAARRITDTIGTVLHTTRDRDLDIHARVSLNGILRDYLPTTLRTFLALDPATRQRAATRRQDPDRGAGRAARLPARLGHRGAGRGAQ